MTTPPRLAYLQRFTATLAACLVAATCVAQQTGDGEHPDAQPAPVLLDREEAVAHRRLGLSLEAAGDVAGAVDEFEAALSLDPWPLTESTGGIDESPYGDLARICARRDPVAQVVRACNRAIGSNRFDRRRLAQLIAYRGDAHLLLGEHDRALADYETALKVDTNDPCGLLGRGRMRARAGAHTAAVSDFDRVISAAPELHEARLARARSLAKLGDFEAAIADFDHILADPEALATLPYTSRDRAAVHCRMGKAGAAAAGWKTWLSTTPDGAGYVQEMLKARGYLPGPVGADFGPEALAALGAWTKAGCPAE